MSLFLLTVRGVPAADDLAVTRASHNEVAGSPEAIAAARSLGDLSHVVYVPLDGANELMFLDVWTSPAGIQQFFSNPQVQQGGTRVFKSRTPIVWQPAQDFAHIHLPPVRARTDRFLGVLAATVKSRDAARAAFDAYAKSLTAARPLGQISHEVWFRLGEGGAPTLDLLAIDTWMDAEGMGRFYGDAQHTASLSDAFAAAPMTSVWRQAPGDWREW